MKGLTLASRVLAAAALYATSVAADLDPIVIKASRVNSPLRIRMH